MRRFTAIGKTGPPIPENFVAFNLTERIQLIGGTWYGGEMEERDVLDHELPAAAEGHRLHALLSQRRRERRCRHFLRPLRHRQTTLSTDPKRRLIGDDEHGWDDDGVFSLRRGCYAKTINSLERPSRISITPSAATPCWKTWWYAADGTVDFDDGSKTENTRVSYPIDHIDNIVKAAGV